MESGTKQSPIFIKTYEMMVWLLGRTGKFPKNQRFLMAKRMENAALDLYERLNEAARRQGTKALPFLDAADGHLANLKVYNRLSKDLNLLAFNQYEHLAGMLNETGRLLGGWQRACRKRSGVA